MITAGMLRRSGDILVSVHPRYVLRAQQASDPSMYDDEIRVDPTGDVVRCPLPCRSLFGYRVPSRTVGASRVAKRGGIACVEAHDRNQRYCTVYCGVSSLRWHSDVGYRHLRPAVECGLVVRGRVRWNCRWVLQSTTALREA